MALPYIEENLGTPGFGNAIQTLLSFDERALNTLSKFLEHEEGFEPSETRINTLAKEIEMDHEELSLLIKVSYYVYLYYRKFKIKTDEFVTELAQLGKDKLGLPEIQADKRKLLSKVFRPKPAFDIKQIRKVAVQTGLPILKAANVSFDLRVLNDIDTDEVIGYEPVVILKLITASQVGGEPDKPAFVQFSKETFANFVKSLNVWAEKVENLKIPETTTGK